MFAWGSRVAPKNHRAKKSQHRRCRIHLQLSNLLKDTLRSTNHWARSSERNREHSEEREWGTSVCWGCVCSVRVPVCVWVLCEAHGSGDICFAALSAYPAADAIAETTTTTTTTGTTRTTTRTATRSAHTTATWNTSVEIGIFIQNNAPAATGM